MLEDYDDLDSDYAHYELPVGRGNVDPSDAFLLAVGELGDAPSAAAFFVARLEDDDVEVCRAVARALGTLGEHAAPHVGTIAAWLAMQLDHIADWHYNR